MQRSLLVGGLVLVTVFLGRLYLVPLHPVLDGPLPAALMAACAGGGCVVGRLSLVASESLTRTRSPKLGRHGPGGGLSLLTRGPSSSSYLFFRFFVLPLLPASGRVLGAAALAGGAAGGSRAVARPTVPEVPEMHPRSEFRRLLLGCLAAASLLGARFGAAPAAPIPVADLVEGFSPTFLYSLSPDGRYVLAG